MPDDTFQSLLGIYRQGYRDNSNGFHPQVVAGKIASALDQMAQLAAAADVLEAKAAAGVYATAGSFLRDADGLSALLGAQRDLIAGLCQTAKAEDTQKITSAGLLYQPNLKAAATVQEQVDATLLSQLDQLQAKIGKAFKETAAALPVGPDGPPPIPPPLPGFEQRMKEFFLRAWPEEATGLGGEEGLARMIQAGIGKAKSYQLAAEDEIGRFLLASVVLGPDFDRQSWAQAILNDSALSSMDKIDRVQDAAINRLASP